MKAKLNLDPKVRF